MDRRKLFQTAVGAAAFVSNALERAQAANQKTTDEDFWFEIRHAFTIDRNIINLNNGSVCPSPRVVQEAEQQYMRVTQMQPSHYVDEFLIPQNEIVRRRLAASFGCDPEEMAITRNATEALEIVQFGLPLKAGDEVLTTNQDYPSMLTAWRQREERDGIVLKTFPFPLPSTNPDDLYDRFEKAITPRTKVLLISFVTFTTGQIFPVQRICRMARARGIETIVDGAHAFAQFPFKGSELDCDYFGAAGHKWLLAPVGTGFLYVRKDRIPRVWPLFASAAPKDNIRKFESVGTMPVAHHNAISEALAFHESIGVERKAARLRYLRDRWVNRVRNIKGATILNADDPAQTCGISAVSLKGWDAGELTDFLIKKYSIHVRPRWVKGEFGFNCIRVTPNIYTTLEEIDQFCVALEAAAVARRSA
jgi:isopenicillin-N epimerase